MEMDDYIMDLHTRGERWSPGCFENFARHGRLGEKRGVQVRQPRATGRSICCSSRNWIDTQPKRESAMNANDCRYDRRRGQSAKVARQVAAIGALPAVPTQDRAVQESHAPDGRASCSRGHTEARRLPL